MKKLLFLLIFTNIALTGFQFYLSVSRSDDSKKLWDIQNQLRVIESENIDLKNKIAHQSAVSELYARATHASLSALVVTIPTPIAVAQANQ